MRKPVYFDYNATTPTDPSVLEAMWPWFGEHFGNPSSSTHPYGAVAKEAVERAREHVAALIGAEPLEIVFTAGATEAINLALKGTAEVYAEKGSHIVTTAIEHSAVLDTCASLGRKGLRISVVGVEPDGRVDPSAIEKAITDDTLLVAVMWANNLTGVIQPIEEIAAITRRRGVLLLTDATQAVGKIPVNVEGVDLLACSAHKFYGPKGVGALFVRRRSPRVRLVPLLDGGGQERGLRGGTLNTPGIVGMGAASELAAARIEADSRRLSGLRDRIEQELGERTEGLSLNGNRQTRLPQTSNLRFAGIRASDLMSKARDLAFSSSSACASAGGKPSHVLKAMGLDDAAAYESFRLGLGRFTTEEETSFCIETLAEAVHQLRHSSASGTKGGSA